MTESVFGHYRLLELLGRGGMGEVYRAHDTRADREVALKVLLPRYADDEEYAQRFRRECRSAARLTDPHVVPIHGFGDVDGRLYLDMRLVDGVDLAKWLTRHGPLPAAAAAAVVGQVATALDEAHTVGIVHRDVKPANVLLVRAPDGGVDPATAFVYLLDFGIARPRPGAAGPDAVVLTRQGAVPGSPSYTAPERLDGVEGDPRSDVYSLACVLHEALTGQPPFGGDIPALLSAHLVREPPRPSQVRPGVPPAFDAVVAAGMAKDPARRYPDAGTLAAAAAEAVRDGGTIVHRTVHAPQESRTVQAGESAGVTHRFGPGIGATAAPAAAPARTQQPPKRARPTRRRRRWVGVAMGALATGLVTAVVVVMLFDRAPALTVVGASVAPAADPGRACDITVDVVGTVTTNGRAGTVTYEWSRSDGAGSGPLTNSAAEGATSVDVHLFWQFSGHGRLPATATLRVTAPTPVEASGSFTYDCP